MLDDVSRDAETRGQTLTEGAAAHIAVTHFRDVSNWDGDYHPTGPTFAKATQGATFTDKRFSATRTRTLAGGWPFAGYHYLDARSSTLAQARHALAVIGKSTAVMWDVEKGGGTFADLISTHDQFVAMGGHGRLVYLPHWYWQSIGSPDLRPLVARGLLLVSSNYPPGGYSDQGPGWAPYGGMTPMFWQYTSKPGDSDAFRGTPDQMARLLEIRATGTPHDTPPPTPTVHVVKTGDSMSSIADGWHVTLTALERANPRAGHPSGNFDLIYPGDRIMHP